jgi:phage/plasmid-like protein (TIGR03299 family)
MSHLLDFSKGFAAIATGVNTETPWHGYVNDYLTEDDTPESAAKKSGLDYTVKKAPIVFPAMLRNGEEEQKSFANRAVLYRDDTGEALSVMSENSYVPAQPIELIAGLFELIKGSGFKLDCIMALKGGKVISALARREAEPGMLGDDVTYPYVGILTSYDGTFARQASGTAIRRVCMNTVRFSLADDSTSTVKQRNSREFTIERANDLFERLGDFDKGFALYMEHMKAFSKVRMTDEKLQRFFTKLYAPEAFISADNWIKSDYDLASEKVSTNKRNTIADLLNFFEDSPGSNLPSADGTLYGAFNTVTYFHDHEARTKGDKRWESASLGNGARKKDEALELALELIS